MRNPVIPGTQYTDWTVLNEAEPRRRNSDNKPQRMVSCRCICGLESPVYLAHLRQARSTGCGCTSAKKFSERLTKHGESAHGMTRAYKIWRSMNSRCHTPTGSGYAAYGALGISVCDQWRHSFETFISDMGHPNPEQSIDRIKNSLGYTPENCRWSTKKTQANNMTSNIRLEYAGQIMTLAEISELTGIKYSKLWYRIQHKNMTLDEALKDIQGLTKPG